MSAHEHPAATTGLHGKYHGLRRTSDNSEVEGWYFVIREGDEAGSLVAEVNRVPGDRRV